MSESINADQERRATAEIVRLVREFSIGLLSVEDVADGLARSRATVNRQFDLVVLLATHGPITTKQLAAKSGRRQRAVNKVVDILCDAGLVQRTRDEDDRRSTLVVPTSSGRKRLDHVMTQLDAYLDSCESLATAVLRELTPRLVPDASDVADGAMSTPALAARISSVTDALDAAYRRHATGPIAEGRSRLALLKIAECEVAQPGILADELGVTSGGMTYILNGLEKRGWIRREFGTSDDRRAASITLAATGIREVDAVYAAVRDVATDLRDLFTAIRDRSQLADRLSSSPTSATTTDPSREL